MRAKKAHERVISDLLDELDKAMHHKQYRVVDRLLTQYPELIHGLTSKCEAPLVLAIKRWDPASVQLCLRHGADPTDVHLCPKESRPKNPFLLASDEFNRRVKRLKTKEAYHRHFEIYLEILRLMNCISPYA